MPAHEQMLPYLEAAQILSSYDVPLAEAHLVQSAGEAAAAAEALGFPVALKAISPELTHKSDAGLVRLNLQTAAAVAAAGSEMIARTEALEGLLVQRMIAGGVEVIIGIHTDPQFGPVIALGAGGVLVELLEDVSLRLPPLTQREAAAMVRETRVWRLLQGFRDRAPADVVALEQLLVSISNLVGEQGERIVALDLNPVMVLPAGQGVRVVDLRLTGRHAGRLLGMAASEGTV